MQKASRLALLIALAATPALARELPPQSLVCAKKTSLRQAMKAADDASLPPDCYFTKTLLKTERLSCENDICKVQLLPLAGKPTIVYTLRRYQP